MMDEPDPDRLRALEARLARAKGEVRRVAGPASRTFSQGEVAWRMVSELVAGLLLGLAIGYGLDWMFGTMPIFLVIMTLLGFIAGVRTMIGTARVMARDTDGDNADEPRG